MYMWKVKTQPSCDGSHIGTDFVPKMIVPEHDGDNYLCVCKQSKNLPNCDGTHTHITEEQIGADGIAISNSAIQAIGCIGARICNTGIATQNPELRKRLNIEDSANNLTEILNSSVS